MQTIDQERRALALRAQQYQEALRKKLNRQLNVGGQNNADFMGGNLLSQLTPDGRVRPGQAGLTQLRAGQAVTDQQLAEVISKSGGNPYVKQLQVLESKVKESRSNGRRGMIGQTGRSVSNAVNQQMGEGGLVSQMLADAQAQADEANYWNQYRFDYGIGNLENLRDRNQERVKNFGQSARTDLEERFSQSLGDTVGQLSGRGLGNSTIVDAFRDRNKRELAREQQRISEMVDDRASRYDTADTANAVNFVERRNDVAPDMGQLLQLAQMYGASGGVDGAAGVPATSSSAGGSRQTQLEEIGYERGQPTMNLPYAVSPYVANEIASSYRGTYPSLREMTNPLSVVGGIQGVVGDITGVAGGTNSNRYPVRHERKPPTAKQQAALSQLQQRVRSRQGAYNDGGGYQGYVDRQQKAAYESAMRNMPSAPQRTAPITQENMQNFFGAIRGNRTKGWNWAANDYNMQMPVGGTNPFSSNYGPMVPIRY